MAKIYESPCDLIGREGTKLGPTDWLAIDQNSDTQFISGCVGLSANDPSDDRRCGLSISQTALDYY